MKSEQKEDRRREESAALAFGTTVGVEGRKSCCMRCVMYNVQLHLKKRLSSVTSAYLYPSNVISIIRH